MSCPGALLLEYEEAILRVIEGDPPYDETQRKIRDLHRRLFGYEPFEEGT